MVRLDTNGKGSDNYESTEVGGKRGVIDVVLCVILMMGVVVGCTAVVWWR